MNLDTVPAIPWWIYAALAVVVALTAVWWVRRLFARAERRRAAAASSSAEGRSRVTWTHRVATAGILAGALALVTVAFTMSFATLYDLATWLERTPFGDLRWMFPIGIDALIVWMLALDLLMEWQGRRAPLARWSALGLSVLTIVLNVSAGHAGDGAASYLGHAGPPLAIILISECVSLWVRHLAGLAAGRVADRIPFGRWLAHPISTAKVARRMVGTGQTDYAAALATEGRRQLAYAMLRQHYGSTWSVATPRHLRWMLDHGDDATMSRAYDIVTAMTAATVAMTPEAARELADPADTIRTLPLLALPGHTPVSHDSGDSDNRTDTGGDSGAAHTDTAKRRPAKRQRHTTRPRRAASDTDTDRRQRAARILAERPDITGAGLAAALGVHTRTGQRLINQLRADDTDTGTTPRRLTAV
ncbi:DUF2637 domain-containing protein [Allonocardiopsis opalescens]|uniref:Uncharacterized protein DUF2637 n=1 Tax=Allonocardiopsis opalescens TaxID=1144618 RepID=A0A2T0Q995_9ACTN|nr:DUF2637 domain-containing protein [Allonocardiopsis opalescens]PRY00423.1 uncharacterized protein DUF2637 [Allonocardiopsis opalescens]